MQVQLNEVYIVATQVQVIFHCIPARTRITHVHNLCLCIRMFSVLREADVLHSCSLLKHGDVMSALAGMSALLVLKPGGLPGPLRHDVSGKRGPDVEVNFLEN
jgi:hypothetical protein